MAERDPIDLIKEQLNQWESLVSLPPDHDLFKQWHAETRTILEKAFSPKSTHLQHFMALRFREVSIKGFASPEIDKINTTRYKKDLEQAKLILLSAIKELTVDRTLFKRLQTTPQTVEVSLKGEYFISSGITDPDMRKAIQYVFEESGWTSPSPQEIPRGEPSLDQRMDQIRRARIGLYDLSSSSKEIVLLELGMAIGMGKEALLLYRKGFKPMEILRKFQGIEYENLTDLKEKLKRRI